MIGSTTLLHPFARPGEDRVVCVRRGRGALVWDDTGREYVDALASLWYCNVGHGRGEIVDAVTAQMRELAGFHIFDRFTNEPAEQLAAALARLAPFAGARVFLTTSGSEAVDSAIKIARLAHAMVGAPERTVIVSRRPSYHGVTFGALAATGIPANQQHFGPMLPEVVQVPHDDLDAVEAVFAEHEHRVAAMLAEPVVGAGGVHPPRPGYLEGLRRLCDEHGAFLVVDEVICGFGRLGTWWGSQRYGVRPDLVTFAKAVTSGYQPLGGVLVSRPVAAALEADPELVLRHGHTYSGHPAACAAALAVMAITRAEGLVDRAPVVGARLAGGLHQAGTDGRVVDVRGDVALWAAELDAALLASEVRDAMLERGVIARPLGASTIAFCPPLVITDEQIDRCVEAFAAAVGTVSRSGTAPTP